MAHLKVSTSLVSLSAILFPALLATSANAATTTYSNYTSLDIPGDGSTGGDGTAPAESDILVADPGGVVVDVDVSLLDMSHTWTGDLDISLIGPDGTTVDLMFDLFGSTDLDVTDLTFDDEAAQDIADATLPTGGTFRPQNPLSAFDGTDPDGTWTLSIFDDAGGDVGVMAGGWELTLTTTPSAVPLPATLPLAVGGFAALGAFGARRRKKS